MVKHKNDYIIYKLYLYPPRDGKHVSKPYSYFSSAVIRIIYIREKSQISDNSRKTTVG